MIAHAPPATDGPLFAFAGGGTGGHLYPSIAVAEAIRRRRSDARFAFFGTRRRIDRQILDRVECEFVPQELPPLSWVPWRVVNAFLGFRRACQACRERFVVDRPVVVVGTGGMASVPPVREAARSGIPTALFNPDSLPGKANRHLARVADCVFAQFEETIAHFPRGVQVVVSGCPVRPEFQMATRSGGIERFGFDANRKTLLITGASQGARTVNQAVVANADFLAACRDWQVLHLTGEADFELVSAGYRGCGVPIKIVAYTEQMAEAMEAADLIVSRAGASTLAEIIAVGRASILMPYPFHKDQHQLVNARCLARVGGARIVNDAIDPAANAPALRAALDELMRADVIREKMGRAARSVGGQDGGAAEVIADRLLEMSGLQGDAASGKRRATRLETVKAL
jgi:UDP-N-acetylglucosamine--N-acetylmuramyl-(pentapeptide) pyrophosphoryl-undecaprenol N-acetylglucosamine transferase